MHTLLMCMVHSIALSYCVTFLTALSQIIIFSNYKMITKDAAVFIFTSGCMNKDELLNIGKYVRRYKYIQIHRVHASCTQQCNSYLVKTSDTVNIQYYYAALCGTHCLQNIIIKHLKQFHFDLQVNIGILNL